jgi:hypothetical protein
VAQCLLQHLVLHEPSTQAPVINRYIHLNPVRINRLGGHKERSGKATNALSAKLAKAGGMGYPALTMAIRRLKSDKGLAKKIEGVLSML